MRRYDYVIADNPPTGTAPFIAVEEWNPDGEVERRVLDIYGVGKKEVWLAMEIVDKLNATYGFHDDEASDQ